MEKAEVNFWKKQATVRYDPDRVTVEEMIEALKKAGYRASLLQKEPELPPSQGR